MTRYPNSEVQWTDFSLEVYHFCIYMKPAVVVYIIFLRRNRVSLKIYFLSSSHFSYFNSLIQFFNHIDCALMPCVDFLDFGERIKKYINFLIISGFFDVWKSISNHLFIFYKFFWKIKIKIYKKSASSICLNIFFLFLFCVFLYFHVYFVIFGFIEPWKWKC